LLYDADNSKHPWKNVDETFHDIFTVAHALGWVGKAIMLRDWWLLHALNISWELVEYSLQTKLANFYECWWDHWVLDGFVCNLGGAWVGMQVVAYLEMHPFDWTGAYTPAAITHLIASADEGDDDAIADTLDVADADTVEDKSTARTPNAETKSFSVTSVLSRLGPFNFIRYEWRVFSSWKNLLSVTLLLLMIETIELCAFTLKHVLWIPSSHPVNVVRLLLWWSLAIPALNEWYLYVTNPRARRVGQNTWLALGVLAAEVTVSLKFGDNMHLYDDDPAHNAKPEVAYGWPLSIVIFGAWILLRFYGDRLFSGDSPARRWTSNALLVFAALPLAYIVYTQDVYYGRNIARERGGTLGML
jgi:phosphatidylserine synthase 2